MRSVFCSSISELSSTLLRRTRGRSRPSDHLHAGSGSSFPFLDRRRCSHARGRADWGSLDWAALDWGALGGDRSWTCLLLGKGKPTDWSPRREPVAAAFGRQPARRTSPPVPGIPVAAAYDAWSVVARVVLPRVRNSIDRARHCYRVPARGVEPVHLTTFPVESGDAIL